VIEALLESGQLGVFHHSSILQVSGGLPHTAFGLKLTR
jgi:hypothetical protein